MKGNEKIVPGVKKKHEASLLINVLRQVLKQRSGEAEFSSHVSTPFRVFLIVNTEW